MGVKADINILKELFWNMSDKLFKRWTWEYIFRPKQVLNCFQEAAKEIWFKFLSNFQDKIAQKRYISFSNIQTIRDRHNMNEWFAAYGGVENQYPCADYKPGEDDLESFDYIRKFELDVNLDGYPGVSRVRGSNRYSFE